MITHKIHKQFTYFSPFLMLIAKIGYLEAKPIQVLLLLMKYGCKPLHTTHQLNKPQSYKQVSTCPKLISLTPKCYTYRMAHAQSAIQ